jgi:predicted hydrolase (HD superfamily)
VNTVPSREEAWALLTEWTGGESLRRHALAVEASMQGYARLFDEDPQEWGLVGLLHDFDYERYPTPADHPFRGCEELERRGYPAWVTRAILSHASYSGVARQARVEKALFACDEMSGFVMASALVRPTRSVLDLEPPSVLKKMKDKAFARGVSRDDLHQGALELELPVADHVAHVIAFLRGQADALGLQGTAPAQV